MSAHGTRARYVRSKCRCEACRTANRDYQRDRNRRYAGVRATLARGDDLDCLRRHLHARDALVAVSNMPRGEARGRRDEITRLLDIIDAVERHRAMLMEVAT